jgi:Protein of unknown function (DUF992)
MPGKSQSARVAAILLIGTCMLAASASSAPEGGVKAGFLTCNVEKGWGFVFGSSRELRCTYSHDHGSLEHYVGHIKKFGVDIGYQAGGVIAWAVIAPTSDVGKGALAGDYAGAAGSASVGVGAGANVLFGGLDKSIALQPVSLEGNVGLNIAGGIAQVTLNYQPS